MGREKEFCLYKGFILTKFEKHLNANSHMQSLMNKGFEKGIGHSAQLARRRKDIRVVLE